MKFDDNLTFFNLGLWAQSPRGGYTWNNWGWHRKGIPTSNWSTKYFITLHSYLLASNDSWSYNFIASQNFLFSVLSFDYLFQAHPHMKPLQVHGDDTNGG